MTGAQIFSSPAIGYDGVIYFGALDKRLYAYNHDGIKRWQFETLGEVYSSPAIDVEGDIYCGSNDGRLYAVHPDGSKKWEFATGSWVVTSPAIGADGTIYFGSYDGKIYALNPDGSKKWEFATSGPVHSSPAIGPDEIIYIGSRDGKLYALTSQGAKWWEFQTAGEIYSSPAISPDGTIYFGSHDSKLYALNPDGSKKWEFVTGNWVYASPTIAVDGTIYVGSFDGKLYAVNANGAKKGELWVRSQLYSCPNFGLDGAVYFGSVDTKLYALKGTNSLASSPWPMFRRNPRHTACGFVQRLLPAGYSPGAKCLVVLLAKPPANSAAYFMEDQPPAGWSIGKVSSGGLFDTTSKRVKFGPFFDATPRTVTYELTPPLGQTGVVWFRGYSSADGLENMVGGDGSLSFVPLHPADNNPVDGTMTIAEMTAYGAAWKRGDAWPTGPNPVPVNYLTRAVALWQDGEFYGYNSNVVVAPLWWVNLASVPASSGASGRPPSVPSGTGGKSVMVQLSRQYQAGATMPVKISATPSAGVLVYAVEDQPPDGWSVADISGDGQYDSLTKKTKWGPYFDAEPRTFTYNVTPASNATGPVTFTGVASFDGTNVAFAGQRKTTDTVVPPRLGPVIELPGGGFQLTLSGDSGFFYHIEASTNLVTWTSLSSFFSTNVTMQVQDPATNFTQRFYRAVLP
jgi:outer membrane protein assembly factor BamB